MSSIAKQVQGRATLPQGTLDLLILTTPFSPAHGQQIGRHIQRTNNRLPLDAKWIPLSGSALGGAKRMSCPKMGNGSEPKAGIQELRAHLEGQKVIGRRGITVEADGLGCFAGDLARRQGELK